MWVKHSATLSKCKESVNAGPSGLSCCHRQLGNLKSYTQFAFSVRLFSHARWGVNLDQWFSTCGSRPPLEGQMTISSGSPIRYPAYQILTLWFIAVEELQLRSSSEGNFMVGGHHIMRRIKGWEPLTQMVCWRVDSQFLLDERMHLKRKAGVRFDD